MTTAPAKWNRFKHSIPMLVVVTSLVVLVFFLLYSNDASLRQTNDALKERLTAESAQIKANLDFFLAERITDLQNMAESGEMYGYLDSLAKQMSQKYGLGASKHLIERMFENNLQRNRAVDPHPLYSRIVLLDAAGVEQINVPAPGTNNASSTASFLEPLSGFMPSGEVQFPTNGAYIRIAQDCYYKSTNYAGKIVAWIKPNRLVEILKPSTAAVNYRINCSTLLLRKEKLFYPFDISPSIVRSELLRQYDLETNRTILQNDRYLICIYPLKHQGVDLVSTYDLYSLSGYQQTRSRWMLIISVTIILCGAMLIFILNTRSLLLKVRLDESMARRIEVEEKNLLLELQIKERKKAEMALSKSEKNYREIFNATKDAILTLRPESGEILDGNDAMIAMFGYSRPEFKGLTLGGISSGQGPFTNEGALEKLHRAQTQGPQMFEWQGCRKQGDAFWIETTLHSSSIGGQGCILAVMRDITERKKANEEKQELEVQLRQSQKMEAVGQLAGGVAHDFNNLLQVIRGNNELALCGIMTNTPLRESLCEISKATEKAASLVRQLLTFSRRVPIKLAPLDLEAVVLDLGKMLRRLIGEHIELDIQTAKPLHGIYADRGQIEQIFVNLCVNARDAIPEGGRITIRVENALVCEKPLHCRIESPPLGYVCLTISDTGVGIPLDIQDHVFEPFFTTKEVGKGTGLGLSTVYSIVQRHEGHVHLRSQPGKGTAFYIYFPAKPVVAIANVDHEDLGEIPNGHGETILVAEDEEMVRNLAVRILQKGGYQVLVANDGQQAMDLFLQHTSQIHLVILDVVMPHKKGSVVFQEIKSLKPKVPCIFTTGYSYGSLEHERLPVEALVMQKPYLPDELLRRVHDIFSTSRQN